MDVNALDFAASKINSYPVRPEGFGFSVSEFRTYKAEQGEPMSKTTASRRLNELVEQGFLESKIMTVKGQVCMIYFKKGDLK